MPTTPSPVFHEWVVVTAAGALGGAAATFIADRGGGADDVEDLSEPPACPRGWAGVFCRAGRIGVSTGRNVIALLLNMSGGGIASFILWATYTSSTNFDSLKFSPAEVAAAITVGWGGVGAVRGLMHETVSAKRWKTAASNLSIAAKSLAQRDTSSQDAGGHGGDTAETGRAGDTGH